ncbi:MAG: hypothetical protein ACU83O_05090, partial [Gammaproteobacteria bacterium]
MIKQYIAALNLIKRIGVATATIMLIGFSHPKARYFLLRRQKKVSKEKATRLPLDSCVPRFRQGLPEGASCPSGNVHHPCRTPNGLF